MYHVAVIAILALALFKLVDVLEDLVPGLTRWHGIISMGLGIGAAFLFDYSVFTGWNTAFREEWMGTLTTGIGIFALTSLWRAVLHWLGSSEGDAPEVRHPVHGPRSMAA